MKIFLAGTGLLKNYPDELSKSKYILESFYSIKDWQIPYIKKCDMFLLDSGAFTFMKGKTNVNFDAYLDKYIEFINKYDVKYFFELDIDKIVGYKKVLEYRKRLEQETGKQCIPVWHKSRGLNEFVKMCSEYDYAAIGGLAIKDINKNQYKYLPMLIKKAHELGCKLHGLGFTSTSYYKNIRFDTVDSTTWTIGGRMGNACYFNGQGMRQYYPSLNGKKPININKLTMHNYSEWIKFQKYAEENL